ncbi:arsenite methyltransferase [Halomarina salina]|uniref:Arsenite methyltransferase n=1 Tax=Halomarina salina TaxID=1872699 RepID=A0ABD5RRT7_9EURY|nr:arsenite methyltransferase [Halomarina salina]
MGVSDERRATRSATEQRSAVRERYADIATRSTNEGCCAGDGCGCGSDGLDARTRELGYDDAELETVAEGANLGLGCGNPTAIAGLEAGEAVLDLGSGAGFNCFLAAQAVGPSGRVLGVDMTPEMVEKARANAARNGSDNVEFRLGEIEHLPVADETVDVVISNCVVNLSPDKRGVFEEAYRVLRPGGRLTISDIVRTAPFPDDVLDDSDALAACVSGAETVDEVARLLAAAGFETVDVSPKGESESFIRTWDETRDLSEYIVSATIEAEKPR